LHGREKKRENKKRNTDAHVLLDDSQQTWQIVRRRLGDAINGQVPVQAPLVDLDLEERAPSALARRPFSRNAAAKYAECFCSADWCSRNLVFSISTTTEPSGCRKSG
jgi:hypothetical protein